MADPVDIRDVIAEEFHTRFALAQPTVKMFFENHIQDEPDNEIFVVVEIMPGSHSRADLNYSGQLIKAMGAVNVRVMVPQDTGTRTARLILDDIYKILIDRQWSLPGGGHVTLFDVDMVPRGEMNGYFSYAVACQFRAYLTLSR